MKRNPVPDLSQISAVDWARLAAYIDGEGCISIKSVHGYNAAARRVFYVDVAVINTDFRLTQWLKDTFGGSVFMNKRHLNEPKWAPTAAWNVASKHAIAILERALPYFIIKREQAETAIAFQATILPGRPYGCKGRPKELIDKQDQFKQRLTDLKGTSGRRGQRKVLNQAPTIQ